MCLTIGKLNGPSNDQYSDLISNMYSTLLYIVVSVKNYKLHVKDLIILQKQEKFTNRAHA